MNEGAAATPSSDASVVGATSADLSTSVTAFFAAFPLEAGAPPVEKLPAVSFFDLLLGTETEQKLG